MLHRLIPSGTVIGILVNPKNPGVKSETDEAEIAAKTLHLQLKIQNAATEAGIDKAFEVFAQQQVAAFSVAADAYFVSRRNQIVGLAGKYAMPGIYPREEYVASGGLMSYAPRPSTAFQLGMYAGEILKGKKPSDLPVQQSEKVYLAFNLKAAKSLTLNIPPTLLAIADEVVE